MFIVLIQGSGMFGPYEERWQAVEGRRKIVERGDSLGVKYSPKDLKTHKVEQRVTRDGKVYYVDSKTGDWVFGWNRSVVK